MSEIVQQANVCTNTTKWYIYSITLARGSNTEMDILEINRAPNSHKDRTLNYIQLYKTKVLVKQILCRPGQALRVPES